MAERFRVCLKAMYEVMTKMTGVRKKAGKNTKFRTEAFMACIDVIATRGSVASSPHIVEQTHAKKKPKIAPLLSSESNDIGRRKWAIMLILKCQPFVFGEYIYQPKLSLHNGYIKCRGKSIFHSSPSSGNTGLYREYRHFD